MNIKKELVERFEKFEFIERIILFGSRVKNPNKVSGDVDLCFVVRDETKTDLIFEEISDILTEKKILIHPIVFKITEFENKIKIKVYKESLVNNGKLLYKSKNNKA